MGAAGEAGCGWVNAAELRWGGVPPSKVRGLFQVDGVVGFDAAFGDEDFIAPVVVVVTVQRRACANLRDKVSVVVLAVLQPSDDRDEPGFIAVGGHSLTSYHGIAVKVRGLFRRNISDIYGIPSGFCVEGFVLVAMFGFIIERIIGLVVEATGAKEETASCRGTIPEGYKVDGDDDFGGFGDFYIALGIAGEGADLDEAGDKNTADYNAPFVVIIK